MCFLCEILHSKYSKYSEPSPHTPADTLPPAKIDAKTRGAHDRLERRGPHTCERGPHVCERSSRRSSWRIRRSMLAPSYAGPRCIPPSRRLPCISLQSDPRLLRSSSQHIARPPTNERVRVDRYHGKVIVCTWDVEGAMASYTGSSVLFFSFLRNSAAPVPLSDEKGKRNLTHPCRPRARSNTVSPLLVKRRQCRKTA